MKNNHHGEEDFNRGNLFPMKVEVLDLISKQQSLIPENLHELSIF